jgi:hypothetical protein
MPRRRLANLTVRTVVALEAVLAIRVVSAVQ